MAHQYPRIPLLGYTDRLSARPGEEVALKVHADSEGEVSVRLARSISADPNPAGMGIVEEPVDIEIPGFRGRRQAFNPGSWVHVEKGPAIAGRLCLTVQLWPTKIDAPEQVIFAAGGAELFLDANGALACRVGGTVRSTGRPLAERTWYTASLLWEPSDGALTLTQQPHGIWAESAVATDRAAEFRYDPVAPVTIAAALRDGHAERHFNGKIEAPTILDGDDVAARWDFAQEIPTTRIVDVGPSGCHGRLVNHAARAMTGAQWDGSEMCWRHKPEHYAAIHFHEDDIYDFGWETDLTWRVPDDLSSGIYVLRLTQGENEEALPLFICPPRGQRRAKLAVLVSTVTYIVYGNNARIDYDPTWQDTIAAWGAWPYNAAEYRELGMSTYNYHTDWSGICHASHLRPLLTLRPGYLTYGHGTSSGLRHFQADSHLISWLENEGIDYDILTDHELHAEGSAVLEGYAAVTTGSHPEYHTPRTLDALQEYRDHGGNLCYLGGNGFYWRVAIHEDEPGMIEIRRAEGGIRAWAADPGEYYNAFDGGYGGLWRRNGRPPQMLAGVGFSSQGQFEGSYYRRSKDSEDAAVAWAFEGIEGDVLGDFGFSGGGAAGFELDRVDYRLGSPANLYILASSERHGPSFIVVHEDQLTHLATWPLRPEEELLRADMVWFEVPGGGEVFSTGSITFCGSLPWNGFDNNISQLMRNVMRRFLGTV